MKKSLVELVKSGLRPLYFSALGLVVTFLTSLATSADLIKSTWTIPHLGVEVPVGLVLATVITAAWKALDLYVRNNKDIKAKGIAPSFLQR